MSRVAMTNMHLPPPTSIYARLRAEPRRAGRPATELAREAIDAWLASGILGPGAIRRTDRPWHGSCTFDAVRPESAR